MDTPVLIAIISPSLSIIGTAILFFLTKRSERIAKLREEKVNHYRVLMSSISDLAVDDADKDDANQRFNMAVNTIGLVAPVSVVNALMDFHSEIKYSNPQRSHEKHDELLIKLLIAIRKDIGLTKKDSIDDFKFHLIGSRPKKNVKS